ncbi:glycosyltransferase [Micromonospora sp. NPDC051227]|uniref:glycosyltransferase n=1 Tax=Micromonospora sp. NPDC051227 TaxID=3364285 RepID=UPI0037BCB598
MRIAHVSDSHLTNPEGVATSVGTTVALLRAAGHRVVLHSPGPLPRCRRRPGEVPSLSVPTRPYRLALPRAPSAPVDVVHVHTTGPLGVAGLRWAATRGVPTVLTWHTDLVAYAAHYPEIPIGAAYAGLRLGLRWRAGDLWALAHPGPGRQARLAALGRTLLAHTTVLIAPSTKTAAMMATMAGRTPIVVLPTPAAAATTGRRTCSRSPPPPTRRAWCSPRPRRTDCRWPWWTLCSPSGPAPAPLDRSPSPARRRSGRCSPGC